MILTNKEAIKLIEHISISFVPTDQYGDYDDPQPYEEALDMAIDALQQTAWIPVEERLPERGKDVLVTRKYYGKDDCIDDCIYVEISACYADGEEWHGYSDEYKMNPRNHKVIAWKPLPEPYKGGEDDAD